MYIDEYYFTIFTMKQQIYEKSIFLWRLRSSYNDGMVVVLCYYSKNHTYEILIS